MPDTSTSCVRRSTVAPATDVPARRAARSFAKPRVTGGDRLYFAPVCSSMPGMKVSGASAVVIGGGSGIGRGIALGLGLAAAPVTVADIDQASADTVRDEVVSAGGTAVAGTVDSTERDSLAALVSMAAAEYGGVDILCSNVGVLVNRGLDEASEQDWAWALELNVMSHVRAVDVFLPSLRADGSPAHIVLTARWRRSLCLHPSARCGSASTRRRSMLCSATARRCGTSSSPNPSVSRCCVPEWCSRTSWPPPLHRSERHGGPFAPAMRRRSAERCSSPGMLPPEAVGPIVVRGIEANVPTSSRTRTVDLVEERHATFVDDFRFFAESRLTRRAFSAADLRCCPTLFWQHTSNMRST